MSAYNGQIATGLENYQNLGVQQGRQNRPSSNAVSPDEAEVKLQAQARQYSLDEQGRFHLKANEASQRLSEVATTSVEVKAKCEALTSGNSTAPSETRHRLASEKHILVPLKEEELELQADLNGFKALHRITCLAHYPQDLLLHLSWIALCIAIETVVNAFFFENERGLLGGAVVAFAVSIVNIGLAGVLGYFFRYINHRFPAERILGWSCLGLFVLTTIFLNSVFSTFRSAYQLVSDPGDIRQTTAAFKEALANASTIFSLHIPFTDILSFVLFFVGCLLGIYAFYKGYTFDDPYPGHGARDRRYRAARMRYQEKLDGLREIVQALHGQRQIQLVSAKNTISELGSRISLLDGEIKHASSEYLSALQRVRNDYHLVLDTYRRTNTSVRTTPAPSYFSELPDPATGVADDRTNQLVHRLTELNNAFENIRTSYVERLTSRLQEETVVATEINGPLFNKYLDEIQKQAEADVANRRQSSR